MIKPTIGRVVWFWPGKLSPSQPSSFSYYNVGQAEPLAALVAFVWNDRCINIGGVDHAGLPFSRTSVPLLQDDDPVPEHAHATWMPYQKGQAAKTEAAEAAAQVKA